MIVVTEQFFIAPEYREAFEAHCRRLAALMVLSQGCFHVLLARPGQGSPFHLLHSLWESLQRFKDWTRSDAFVIAANGATRDFPDPAILVPKRTAIEVIDEVPAARRAPRVAADPVRWSTGLQCLAHRPWDDWRGPLLSDAGGYK